MGRFTELDLDEARAACAPFGVQVDRVEALQAGDQIYVPERIF